jgi:hypothetical protein
LDLSTLKYLEKLYENRDILLYEMLIYKIARHIILGATPNCNLACKFPSGNGYIDVVLTWEDDGFTKIRRFKLDPEAPTKVSLIIAPKIET